MGEVLAGYTPPAPFTRPLPALLAFVRLAASSFPSGEIATLCTFGFGLVNNGAASPGFRTNTFP